MGSGDFVIRVCAHTTSPAAFGHGHVAKWTGKVDGLSFSTKNPGGFSSCNFKVDLPFDEAINIYSRYNGHYLIVEGGGGIRAWEGRIEEIVAEPGSVSVTAYGMWSSAFDRYFNDGSLDPSPTAEDPITNRDGWAPFTNTDKQLAQSFKPGEALALQDIQVRLANFGVSNGTIYVELHESSESGTLVASSTIQVSSLTSDEGFSEYLGLTTDYRLDTATTYYLVLRPDSEYFASLSSISGTHTGASGSSVLIDSTKDWISSNIQVGMPISNTTQAYTAHISATSLRTLAVADKVYFYDDSLGTYTDITSTVCDGNTGTEYTFSNFDYAADRIFVGYSSKFGGIYIWPGNTPQSYPSAIKAEYFYDASWVDIGTITDNTVSNGASFAIEGSIRWAKPSDWDTTEPYSGMGSRYWAKLSFQSQVPTSFTLAELQVGVNDQVSFSDLGSNDWDNGDAYTADIAVAVGHDSVGNYADGKLRAYNGSSWADYSGGGDGIFYVWGHPKYYYSTGGTTYASDVIADIVDECDLIDYEALLMEDTGRAVNPIKFTGQERHGDVIQKVMSFGSSGSSPEPLCFGVWENGVAHLRKTTDGRQWYMSIKNLPSDQQALSISKSLRGYRTKTAVLYSDESGARNLTAWVENTDIYDMLGTHFESIFSAENVSTALAETLADLIAEVYRMPSQEVTVSINGYIQDGGRRSWPAWVVRAGDIIEMDVLPTSAILDSSMETRIKTLYVKETEYSADNDTLRVSASDITRDILDIILELSGVSGRSEA